ncbi:GTP cyclohydrolase II [Rubellimicrobium aerolatum]|uniref:GTP cyclohydrolase-2 n=1 Tax=Rubellimicrobium aerolatum TaxID=490979 RepID=A0ABW0SAG3_9RHOB|nr:GTP cyclohydrolase II [Rubellimicrobium aerolatum]MBP1805295.1 GTP cyclohydrolase II [Rubellimicrobium aerolatum]
MTDPLAPPFALSDAERLARARSDLRMGLPVWLAGPDGAALALAAETASAPRLRGLRDLGEVALALTARRAGTLRARAYDGDLARLRVPGDADLGWLRATADPAEDLARPMKGPFQSFRDADGPPPALARAALRLAKAARLLPAALLVAHDAPPPEGVARLPAALALADTLAPLSEVVSARVPLAVSQAGRVHVFRSPLDDSEHVAVEIGSPPRDAPVLARLHSACFTGDLLGSLKCDCGPQLHAALDRMAADGAGVLLYLDQEGRGIGLANKMRAYSLQDQGFDTVEANHRLGFEDDERDFRVGAQVLKALGFDAVRLLTNNPRKVRRMEEAGVRVAERVPLRVGLNDLNAAYLATKAAKSGHLL